MPDFIHDDTAEHGIFEYWISCDARSGYQVDVTTCRITMFAKILAVAIVVRHCLIVIGARTSVYRDILAIYG